MTTLYRADDPVLLGSVLTGEGVHLEPATVVDGLTVFVFWQLGHITVLGYTPLMLAIVSFGGLTALGLGIVGQYLWLSLQNTRNRPSFVVRSTHDFDPNRETTSEVVFDQKGNSSLQEPER